MPHPVVVAAGTGDNAIVAARLGLRLMGLSVAETASSAAVASVDIRHGDSATDPILVPVMNCEADGFDTFWFGHHGIDCPDGIFINRVTGNTTLVLYIDPLEAVP